MTKRFFFQVFSIVLKSLYPLESKNTFILVLAFFSLFSKKLFFGPKSNFLAIFDALVTHFLSFESFKPEILAVKVW